MTTIDSAKDMESIRLALRQGQINFFGFAYGTYLAHVYATLYPTRVRRMVLDSNVDPRNIWFRAIVNQIEGLDRNINLWVAWLAKYDSVYRLGKTQQQVAERWNATQTGLDAQIPNGTVGPAEWNDVSAGVSYSQSVWPAYGAVEALSINTQNFSLFADDFAIQTGPVSDNEYASLLAVICTDTQWPRSDEYIEREYWQQYLKAPIFTWNSAWQTAPCQFWPQEASVPVNVDGSDVAAILLIGETLDAATPVEGSLEVRRRFPRAILIEQPNGTTHMGSLGGNECVMNVIAEYLRSGQLPARKAGDEADVLCSPLPEPVPTVAP